MSEHRDLDGRGKTMMPPGRMALELGCNGYGVCPKCEGMHFHLMVRVESDRQILVVTKCANQKCDNEEPVLGDDSTTRKFRA